MNIWNQLEGAVPNDTRNIDPENVITVLGIYFRIVEKKSQSPFIMGLWKGHICPTKQKD